MLTAAVNTGDLLDLALIALAALVAFRGYRQGVLVGAGSLIGFIGGALRGARLAGPLAGLVAPGPGQSVISLATVLVVAVGLEELLAYVAAIGRDALRLRPLRVVDGVFGTVLSVTSMLFVAFGSLIFLWHECGEDLPVFCYRMGVGAVAGLRRRGLVLVPTGFSIPFSNARNRSECLTPSVTSSICFSTPRDSSN